MGEPAMGEVRWEKGEGETWRLGDTETRRMGDVICLPTYF